MSNFISLAFVWIVSITSVLSYCNFGGENQKNGLIISSKNGNLNQFRQISHSVDSVYYLIFTNYTHYVEYLQLSGYRMETEINASFKLETKLIKDQCNITSLFFYPLKTENSLQQLLISPPNSGVPTRDCKSLQETLDCAVEAKQKLTRTLNFSIEIGRVIPSNCFNFIRDDSNSTSSISLTVIQKQFQYPVYSYSIFQREMKDVETYLVGNENKTNIFVHLINSWEDKYLISEAKLKYENLLQNFGNLWTTGNSISMIWPDFLAPTLFKVTLNKTEISHFDSDCEAISSSKILVNKDYLGSRFDPYIKTPHPRLTTQSEITYMIELATTKFQKLWIKRFLNDPLTEEYADVENWIIEATVEANLKKRNAVELMYEIHLGRNEFSYFQNFAVQFDEFIRLLDDFAKANKRAEGTIRGFFFVGFVKEMEKLSETEILTVLETSRKIANERNLLFGVHFDMNFTNNEFLTISSIEKKALNFVNFIIYSDVNYFDFLPNADLLGSAKTFHNYVHRRALKPLLIKRSKLQAFKQDVEVIAKLFWVRIGGLYFGTKTDFATYLESVNYWATLHQFPVYANRVFDNTTSQCCGWWMVSDYRNLSNHDVFFEIDKESHTVMKLPNATANKQFISANFNHHNQRLTLQDHWKTNGIYQAKEDIALSIRKTLVNSNISYAHITQKVSEVFGLYVLKIFPNGGFELPTGNQIPTSTEIIVNTGSIIKLNHVALSVVQLNKVNSKTISAVYLDEDETSLNNCSSYNNINGSLNSITKYMHDAYDLRFGITVPAKCFLGLVDNLSWTESQCQMDFLIIKITINFSIYSYTLFERHMKTEILDKIDHLKELTLNSQCNSKLEPIVHVDFKTNERKLDAKLFYLYWEFASYWGHSHGIRTIWATVFDAEEKPTGWLNVENSVSNSLIPKIRPPYAIEGNTNFIHFDQERLGAYFNWNVRTNVTALNDLKKYTFAEIVTMLKVVSSRFSLILAMIPVEEQDYNIIDAAVQLNTQFGHTSTISLVIMTREEVWFKVNDSRLFDNMMHACNRANKAYPYTVVGVSILRTKDRLQTSYEHSYNNIDLKEKLDTYRAKVHRNGLKFGYILQPAYADFKPNAGGNQADATKLFVQKADFVIYNEPYFGNQLQLKSAADFSHYFDNKRMRWQQVSEAIWRENANTEISIFDAFYESIEYIDKEQLENVVIFWETMNTFSKLYNITIFAGQAFNGHTHANHWNRFGGWWSLLDLTDLTNQFHFVDATIANDNDVFRGAPIQPITLNETLAEVICNFSPIHPPTLIQRVSETMVGVIGRTFRTIYFEFHEDFEDIKEFVEAFEESRYQSNLKLNSVFMVGVNTANELFFRRNLNSRHLSIETKVLSFVSTISICYTITYFPGDYRKNMTVLTDQLRLTRKLQNNNVALVGFVLALPCEEYLSKGVYEEEGQAIVSSDFVICSTTFSQFLDANALINKLDFQRLFVPYLNKLLAARHLFREFNPKVTVKFTVGWRTDRNLTDFLTFYDVINKWASNNDYPFVIKSAFDKLEENETSGWWKIVDYDNLDENASYVEKQMEYFKSESERNRGNIVVVTTEKTSGLLFPLVSTAGGLLLLCTLTIIILVIRLRRANSLLSYEEVENFIAGRRETVQNGSMLDLDGEESGLNCPYNQELEIAKENFNFGEAQLIGSGNFGRVYKMQVPGLDGEVAVKVPKLREGGREAVLSTLREIKILAYVGSHTNVVKVLGAYTKEIRRGTVYIVTELCSEGSLVSYLRTKTALHSLTNVMVGALTKTSYSGNETELKIQEESTSPICKYELLRFALEIADGMDFIASRKVVHADLAARNVLLDCDRRAKICDFGLSRKLYNYTEYVKKNREPLPWRWMAIETLKNMEFSTMSDVWSYGVTLWEIFSLGAVPYSRLTWNQEFEIELLGGMRLDQPIHASEEIYATMQSCWNVSPSCRPSFADLKTYFAGLRNEAYELFG